MSHEFPVILVIEDDASLRESLLALLDFEGYGGAGAGTAHEGVDLAQRTHPDAIVLDINLPGMSGLHAHALLRQGTARDIPIILMSGTAEKRLREMTLDSHAEDYLAKPFSIDTLLFKVALALQHKHDADLQGHRHDAGETPEESCHNP